MRPEPRQSRHRRLELPSEASVRALARALADRIEGDVRFDVGSRALYATDASNYRQVPIGVVVPRSVDDIVAAVDLCREHGAPILMRGGGTSLAGQCCNVAVVIDCSKHLNRIIELDPDGRRARVEPGCVLDTLRDAAERHHLTFGPDPSTHNHCALGGMIGNNSCGVHSIMAGRTADNVEALDILTYDGLRLHVGATPEAELEAIIGAAGPRGRIYGALRDLRDRYAKLIRERYPRIPRRVSGFNLDELLPENGFNVARALVGSEGTCAVTLSAELRLVPSPPCRAIALLGFADVYTAGDHVPAVLEYGPIGLEGIDDVLTAQMKKTHLHTHDLSMLPEGGGWLLAEFGGDTADEAADKARLMVEGLERARIQTHAKIVRDPQDQLHVWKVREAGLGATAHVPGEKLAWEGWEDAAVPPARVGAYLRDFRKLLDRFGYRCALYGHFGDGCVHVRIDFDLMSRAGIAHYRNFATEAADLVVSYGGSLSGEHGDGQSRAELLSRMLGKELVEAFREFKAIWDPAGRMNPGKVVDPYRLDENLRVADFQPEKPLDTVFAYRADGGHFGDAVLRCVGVGECRRKSGGVMCPSYRATRDEQHSTRGRARLLFEMTRGDALSEGWRSQAVRDALDLCLACKGCKGDCPVKVDMATYKAEFMSHYYRGRLRPREAYSMGLIHWWARAAAAAPGVANALGNAPGLSRLVKAVGGIAGERRLPRFASETFRRWWRRRASPAAGGQPVVLWVDTFNDHFHPEVLKAAAEVLEAAGCRVVVPNAPLCCGRPLYAWGMLELAKRQLAVLRDALSTHVAEGAWIVGVEPACVSALRDELPDLFADDRLAATIAERSLMLSDFLDRHASFAPSHLDRRVLFHPHCHRRSVLGLDGARHMFDRIGVACDVPETGCCGMAGSFGFEASHYAVAMSVGELGVLPAVRKAGDDIMVVSDGFSCREQIEQATGRRVFHVAELLRDAIQDERGPA